MRGTAKALLSAMLPAFAGLAATIVPANAQVAGVPPLDIDIVYLERAVPQPPVLSNLVAKPDDEGLAGARLAIADNKTTGQFLGQTWTMNETVVSPEEDWLDAARKAVSGGPKLIVANAPAADLLALADLPDAADDLIFNAKARETSLRQENCRANVVHTAPDRLMLTDALMQFLLKRQWRDVMLVEGNAPADTLFADAMAASSRKFGVTIGERKRWLADADIRRNAGAEVPRFTQGDYDVLLIADEAEDYAPYFLYNTFLPRPVAGSAGLTPTGWSAVVEEWGAAQLQSRFADIANRPMNDVDYAAWVAIRAIGEAATRAETSKVPALRKFLLSPDFQLAAFKGLPVSFRPWDGQMRQGIALVHPQAMVDMAPIEGFLHQKNELDSLGLDEQDSQCEAF